MKENGPSTTDLVLMLLRRCCNFEGDTDKSFCFTEERLQAVWEKYMLREGLGQDEKENSRKYVRLAISELLIQGVLTRKEEGGEVLEISLASFSYIYNSRLNPPNIKPETLEALKKAAKSLTDRST